MGIKLKLSPSGGGLRGRKKNYFFLATATLFTLAVAIFFTHCSEEEPIKEKEPKVSLPKISAPTFNADSAYHYIQTQVDFGPRVPNSVSHQKCGDYLEEKLKSFGFELKVQTGKVKAYNNVEWNIRNIMGRLNPEKKNRILLLAHWDTRYMADRDTSNVGNPIDGANDGGSGVGVLLEIARLIKDKPPHVGIDILFVDVEDQGESGGYIEDTWCLGTQYWAKNNPIPGYQARYGILLDMVGGNGAKFMIDETSQTYAPQIAKKVWQVGNSLGYGNYFINGRGGMVVDDHKYINTLMGIPCIDVVDYSTDRGMYGDFHPSHHTHRDNMDIIDKTTLKAVGQTVLEVIYANE